ncbi:MAG TPA: hypothetical protein VHH32_06405 [Gemmatimonadales bacterium]|nr:hypothetical protein [Gemmatimonadales bacterium]
MGLVAAFIMVWFLIALGLRALAKRVMGSVRYSWRLWQELTMLLAFLVGFLLARSLYNAYDRRYLTPLWEERHGAQLFP